jgi:hypothetical protein
VSSSPGSKSSKPVHLLKSGGHVLNAGGVNVSVRSLDVGMAQGPFEPAHVAATINERRRRRMAQRGECHGASCRRGRRPPEPPWAQLWSKNNKGPDEDHRGLFGAGDRTRTSDPGLMSPLLYQLSYAGTRQPTTGSHRPASGSGGWIRTNDLRVMSPTSFHCSTPQRNRFPL